MGRIFVVELEGRNYRCKFCTTPLALVVDLLSRGFHCRRGKAYLFSNAFAAVLMSHELNHTGVETGRDKVVLDSFRLLNKTAKPHPPLIHKPKANVTLGPQEERMMLSGMHTVADTFCCCCGQIVGWKYEAAQERSQKYKEGKFVLERGRIIDGVDSEFYIDTHSALSSDAEDP